MNRKKQGKIKTNPEHKGVAVTVTEKISITKVILY